MGFASKDRIANVIKMRRDRVVEEERVFHLARIADHATVADDDVVTNIRIMANFTVPPDNRWAFNHRAILDYGAFPDKHLFANVRNAFTTVAQPRSQVFR